MNIKTERGRRKALNSTSRLEDFKYNDNCMEAPTPNEMEEEQKKADDIYYEHLMRYHKANDFLDEAKFADTIWKRASWLQKLGYNGVEVRGYTRTIPFNVALKEGYTSNIYRMFEKVKNSLSKMVKESSRYIFLDN